MHGGNVELLAPKYGFGIHEILDFSANINPWGPPPAVERLMQDSWKDIIRYPDPDSSRLRSVLARWHGVNPENIVPANGASELIYWTVRLAKPGTALIFAPAFTEYAKAAESAGRTVAFTRPLARQAIVAGLTPAPAKAGRGETIVFISNPNNPSGNLYSAVELENWIQDFKSKNPETLFVIDESFLPFVLEGEQNSLIPFALKTPQVIILRSLTKILSIPGLRLGYAVAHSDTAAQLNNLMPTWRVNVLAQKAGEKIFSFSEFIQQSIVSLNQARMDFIRQLRYFPQLQVWDSCVNFFLVRILTKQWNALDLTDAVGKRGILIRNCDDFVGLETGRFIRLAVRKPEENARLIQALKEEFQILY